MISRLPWYCPCLSALAEAFLDAVVRLYGPIGRDTRATSAVVVVVVVVAVVVVVVGGGGGVGVLVVSLLLIVVPVAASLVVSYSYHTVLRRWLSIRVRYE